ncbi:methionyl-tRNA formyltransferase [Patescibacteria group bacterium]|nr:methionyl-tRNA formyltransferase [Patescibacteria group bacterium]MBU1722106.1 methionyl-tRNA formyltransferase [Patescibacteria group bacterium]MBU1901596.1 methionyl-tRNA formyltransferase [Patescibacteria group bacterium]
MKITLLMDNPKSWYLSYARQLQTQLMSYGHVVSLVHSIDNMEKGDIAFFLSCEKIMKKSIRDLHTHSLVVHSSALPEGKGWSPLTWSILAGETSVTNTLFKAVDSVDAGTIYAQNVMHFIGNELLDELHDIQGNAINDLIINFIKTYPKGIENGYEQQGKETFYSKRTPKDSELDLNKTINEQFNLFRVVDNEKYPAFFYRGGKKYILKIYKG